MPKKIKMTRKQFTERMWDIADKFGGDIEAGHSAMDDLMVEYLREQGLNEAMDVFVAQDKWYA